MKKVFIVNPNSGSGKALQTMQEIDNIFKEKDYDYQIILTDCPKDATKIVSELHNSIVFSVGGDGTLNEIINGINSDCILGIIPAGSGNDFYKSIDINTSLIDLGHIKYLNSGKLEELKFINIASFGGIDSLVGYYANEFKDNGDSNNAYIKGIKKAFNSFRPVQTDFGFSTIVTICNGRYYGNGIQIAPFSDVSDGYLDLCLADEINKKKMLYLLFKLIILNGKHVNSSAFHHEKIQNLIIDSKFQLICNVDGEVIKGNHFEIKIIPGSIKYFREPDCDIQKIISRNIKKRGL